MTSPISHARHSVNERLFRALFCSNGRLVNAARRSSIGWRRRSFVAGRGFLSGLLKCRIFRGGMAFCSEGLWLFIRFLGQFLLDSLLGLVLLLPRWFQAFLSPVEKAALGLFLHQSLWELPKDILWRCAYFRTFLSSFLWSFQLTLPFIFSSSYK